MCGRFFLDLDFEKILKSYEYILSISDAPEFHLGEQFPGQGILTVDRTGFHTRHWGMKYDFMKSMVINGRAETIGEKKMFKDAYSNRRLLIPASGYYEWENDGSQKHKRAIYLPNREIFSFAGIYNPIKVKDEVVDAFVILTVPAQDNIKHIHPRMPLILKKDMEKLWLIRDNISINELYDQRMEFKVD